jgi:hypothetical protein
VSTETVTNFKTDKIGLACYLMVRGVELVAVLAKSKSRAIFVFKITPEEGTAQEVAYTTSDSSRFFEAFKYLRGRALKGS